MLGNYKILPEIFDELPERLAKAFYNNSQDYALGGVAGTDQLLNYYKERTAQIFIHPNEYNRLIESLKLMPADKPEITILSLFSETVIFKQNDVRLSIAHPILLYAELLRKGGKGTREMELAEKLYNKYIAQDLDES